MVFLSRRQIELWRELALSSQGGMNSSAQNTYSGRPFQSYATRSTTTAVPYASTSVTPCITSVASHQIESLAARLLAEIRQQRNVAADERL